MQRSGRELRNAGIQARDGEIGHVEDLYFDDRNWEIRYLVIDTRNWLPGRKVLISPEAVERGGPDDKSIKVNLTKDQIRNSPDISSDPPVSKQSQANLAAYYGWSYVPVGMVPPAGGYVPPAATGTPPPDTQVESTGDPHLRSMREVMGYHIEADDGEIGHIDDFLISAEQPRIEKLVIDTSNWPGGRTTHLPVSLVREVNWEIRRVRVDIRRAAIEQMSEEHVRR